MDAMLTFFETLPQVAYRSLGISSVLFYNLLYTGLIFMAFGLARYLLHHVQEPLTEQQPNRRGAEVIHYLVRVTLNVIVVVLLVKIWFGGKSGFGNILGFSARTIEQWVQSVLAVFFYFVVKKIAFGVLSFRKDDPARLHIFQKTVGVVLGFLLAVALLKIWMGPKASMGTYLGLLSAGLAIALGDVVLNIAAGVYLMIARPFKVGQRIQILNSVGDVIDIGILQFSILEVGQWVKAEQSTGRVVYFSNSMIFKNAVANYHAGFDFIWSEIPITVAFESDWEKALGIIKDIANQHAEPIAAHARMQIHSAPQAMMLSQTPLEPMVWVSVNENGVLLTLRYVCPPHERRSFDSQIWQAILRGFAQHPDIDFAYVTHRFFDNVSEGKPSRKSPPPSP